MRKILFGMIVMIMSVVLCGCSDKDEVAESFDRANLYGTWTIVNDASVHGNWSGNVNFEKDVIQFYPVGAYHYKNNCGFSMELKASPGQWFVAGNTLVMCPKSTMAYSFDISGNSKRITLTGSFGVNSKVHLELEKTSDSWQ